MTASATPLQTSRVMQIRNGLAFAAAIAFPFLLQPVSPIRNLTFWLPLASLGLVVLVWFSLHGLSALREAATRRALIAAALVVAALAVTRFLPALSLLPARPPDPLLVAVALTLLAGLGALAARLSTAATRALWLPVALLLVLFILLKTEAFAALISAGLRALGAQDLAQASASDVNWLGYSYLAFRLLAVLRDRMTGARTLRPYGLAEFVVFALFTPAFLSGPIDRADRFLKDWRAPWRPNVADLGESARRILIGLVKKLALADTLALVALNGDNALHAHGLWMWLLVYAYALRIYFDFGGYSDIAIGIGRALGVRLPENFERPYLKPNLTQFWNSWHMSLSQWFRGYWFNPLTRALRLRDWQPMQIVAVGQASTMMLIALWHGVTANFALWGAWHAVGLFVHNRFADALKARPQSGLLDPRWTKLRHLVGVLITFHFVALGWVWFATPMPASALRVFGALLGVTR